MSYEILDLVAEFIVLKYYSIGMKRKISRPTKRNNTVRRNKRFRIRGSSSGGVLILLGFVFLFAFLLTGAGVNPVTKYPEPTAGSAATAPSEYSISGGCCDTGSGPNCTTVAGKEIEYNGKMYGLLKSSITSGEKGAHIRNSGVIASNGQAIFLNARSKGDDSKAGVSCTGDKDWYYKGEIGKGHICWGVPDEQIILLCSDQNPPGECDRNKATALWDAYFRIEDAQTQGIPSFIKYCNANVDEFGNIVPEVAGATDIAQALEVHPSKQNLQLYSFTITPAPPITLAPQVASAAGYLTPYCKPAIYLYPEENMPIHVQVFPVGKMTVTIPKYPSTGWNVFAYIDGTLNVQNSTYDYLYYEAEIPDSAIVKPDTGYVIAKKELPTFVPDLLKKLGLNSKERAQFTEYWTTVLPDAAFYKISVIPQPNLEAITPLAIYPTPKTVIRVSLYFEALDQFETVQPPVIIPVSRVGFTVVEWGGMFKRDTDRPFTCFM
jgi:hypothetical protein